MSQARPYPGDVPPVAGGALPDAICWLLTRPDLRIAPHERSISFAAELGRPFRVDLSGHIRLGAACLTRAEHGAVHVRHALELALLLPRLPAAPLLAGLAAARVAALFAVIHGAAPEPWHALLAAPAAPDPTVLMHVWPLLAALQDGAPSTADTAACARLAEVWSLIGPAEALLQSGGDQRLRVDPATGLNGYGCSHRPRPWAVTFASSTASSSSERGFAAAEAARQRITLAALHGSAAPCLADEATSIRAEIGALAGLAPGGGVVLAASGTDCELLALALAEHHGRPVTTLLIAPEETGSGVPLAAIGRHFATDTARGAAVCKGDRVAGFGSDITLIGVPARNQDGTLRKPGAVDADCVHAAEQALAAGRTVIVHLLDVSKTGFLAPGLNALDGLCGAHADRLVVVVDACQLRLGRQQLQAYLHRGWMVLITGSKFLTGPPFAGAILLPPTLAARSARRPPAGLADYSSAPEWPDAAAVRDVLPGLANYGLLLRWRAALAEWVALNAVEPARQHEVVARFCARVRQGIAANADLRLLETPAPLRSGRSWDGEQTIIGFYVRPHDPLDPADARRLYHWLNADIRPGLPAMLSAEQERLACLRCHIGQPVPLPGPGGRSIGVLRLSAGARLIAGEPSHHDLDEEARLLREIHDALSVLAKISLVLQHWDGLLAADPKPSF